MKKIATIFYLLIGCYHAVFAQVASTQSKALPQIIQKNESGSVKSTNIKMAGEMQLMYFIVKNRDSGFGYDIYANGNLYIHQPNIPAVPGERAFADTASAGKTARLAIGKIRQGEMPPSIGVAELKKMGVIK